MRRKTDAKNLRSPYGTYAVVGRVETDSSEVAQNGGKRGATEKHEWTLEKLNKKTHPVTGGPVNRGGYKKGTLVD